MDAINVEEVEQWRDALVAAGALNAHTVGRVMAVAGAVFRDARRRFPALVNPFENARKPPTKRRELRPGETDDSGSGVVQASQVFSSEELGRLIEHAEPGLYHALLATVASTGIRGEEAYALQWSNVELGDDPKIHIRRSLSWARAIGEQGVSRPKFFRTKTRAGNRSIGIPHALSIVLKTWKLQCPPSPHGGRLAVHIISGGDDADQIKDGDFLTHDERYARTDEYVEILRRIWTADKPVDHDGRYYTFQRSFSDVKPLQKPHLPIYFGGSSDAAIAIAGKHADVYALWGEPLAEAAKTIARVRASAGRHGRRVRFSLSMRPILAKTEHQAWARAQGIIETIRRTGGRAMLGAPSKMPQNVGSQRLLAAAAQGEILDQRLWTAVAAATGARGNTTALVGTPEQVAESLIAYYDLGVTTFLIRGFDPLEDAIDYGRELIPIVRSKTADREEESAAAHEVAG